MLSIMPLDLCSKCTRPGPARLWLPEYFQMMVIDSISKSFDESVPPVTESFTAALNSGYLDRLKTYVGFNECNQPSCRILMELVKAGAFLTGRERDLGANHSDRNNLESSKNRNLSA